MSSDNAKGNQDKKAGAGKKKEVQEEAPPPLEEVKIPEELTTVEEQIRSK